MGGPLRCTPQSYTALGYSTARALFVVLKSLAIQKAASLLTSAFRNLKSTCTRVNAYASRLEYMFRSIAVLCLPSAQNPSTLLLRSTSYMVISPKMVEIICILCSNFLPLPSFLPLMVENTSIREFESAILSR